MKGNQTLVKSVLAILASGALLVVAAAMPNAVQALAPLVKQKRGNVNELALKRMLDRLRERKQVKFVVRGGRTVLEITESGKKRFREFQLDDLKLPVPSKWDGKWTIVLFDIPENKKTARNALRRTLERIGFFPYHKSVLVHPSDAGDEIDYIVELFHLQPFVSHFRTPSLGKQEVYARKHFELY